MRHHLILVALVTPAIAHADSATAKAEALFRQGRDLLAEGKLAEACAAFDGSQKLDPATTTLFNQADCREKNGQLATAWGYFLDAERQTRTATDDVGARLHTVAVERAEKLEPRLSKLTISVPERADGLVVMRGSDVVDPVEWDHALPVDGGTYTLTARIASRQVWSETVTIANEGDTKVVVVHPAAEGHQTPLPLPPPPPPPIAGPSRRAAWITAGAGAVLLGGALAFDLIGDSTYEDAKAKRDLDLYDSANHMRYAAEGLLAAGAVTVGVSVYLWLRHPKESPTRVSRTIAPVVGNGFAGVQVGGSW